MKARKYFGRAAGFAVGLAALSGCVSLIPVSIGPAAIGVMEISGRGQKGFYNYDGKLVVNGKEQYVKCYEEADGTIVLEADGRKFIDVGGDMKIDRVEQNGKVVYSRIAPENIPFWNATIFLPAMQAMSADLAEKLFPDREGEKCQIEYSGLAIEIGGKKEEKRFQGEFWGQLR